MKILIVMNDFFNRSNGMSISTQRFAASLRKMGHEVRIAANASNGNPDYPMEVLRIPIFAGIIEKEGYTFAKINKKLLEEAVDWADVVHVEDPFFLCAKAARLAKAKGKTVTGTFHLYPENMTYSVHIGKSAFFNYVFMTAFKKGVYNKCDRIMCPTDQVKARLKKYHFSADLYTISNGIPEEIVDYGNSKLPCRNKAINDKKKFRIITVGRYSKEKNQGLLLDALLKCQNNENIELTVAGKGPLENKLKQKASRLPFEVEFGFFEQDELLEKMSQADIYVHCADIEVEGMSCMEAFACGAVPLISKAKLSSTKSYALDDNNIYKANDSDDLAGKIDYWIEHPKELEASREKYMQMAKNMTVDNSAQKLAAMMRGERL